MNFLLHVYIMVKMYMYIIFAIPNCLHLKYIIFQLFRKKKHVREQKKKQRERLANKLSDNTGEFAPDEQDLFSLKHIQNKKVKH